MMTGREKVLRLDGGLLTEAERLKFLFNTQILLGFL
jgi:hypothetical protein